MLTPAPPVQALPPKPVPNRVAGGLIVAGGGIAVAGCFLPWISASAPFVGTVSRDGVSNPDGQLIAGLAAASALIGVVMLARRVWLVVPIVVFLLALIATWTVVLDYQDVNSRIQNVTSTDTTIPIVAEVGSGIYATGLGIVVWAIGAIAGLARQSKSAVSMAPAPWQPPFSGYKAQVQAEAGRSGQINQGS
jgi:hypothetical protein